VHVTEMITYNNLGTNYEFVVYIAFMFIFGARNFHPRPYGGTKTGAENWRQKTELIYGAGGFWSVCHRYYTIGRGKTKPRNERRIIRSVTGRDDFLSPAS